MGPLCVTSNQQAVRKAHSKGIITQARPGRKRMQQKQKGGEHCGKQSTDSSVTKAISHLDQTAISLPVVKTIGLGQACRDEARSQTSLTRPES